MNGNAQAQRPPAPANLSKLYFLSASAKRFWLSGAALRFFSTLALYRSRAAEQKKLCILWCIDLCGARRGMRVKTSHGSDLILAGHMRHTLSCIWLAHRRDFEFVGTLLSGRLHGSRPFHP